ncbi:MAG: hypothetical protein ACRELC_03725 [Gemmatimonadota bacterium]
MSTPDRPLLDVAWTPGELDGIPLEGRAVVVVDVLSARRVASWRPSRRGRGS